MGWLSFLFLGIRLSWLRENYPGYVYEETKQHYTKNAADGGSHDDVDIGISRINLV